MFQGQFDPQGQGQHVSNTFQICFKFENSTLKNKMFLHLTLYKIDGFIKYDK